MNRDTALFLSVACVAAALWASSVTISNQLAHVDAPTAETAARGNDALTEVRRVAAADPTNLENQRALADGLAREGLSAGNSSVLAEALETYLRILEKEPENEGALLGIASLAFQAGVLDKAAEYYGKYVQLVPGDLRARNDFALVYIQSDRADLAIPILEDLRRDAPDLFPTALSLALAYRTAGDEEKAKSEAERARALAPDDQAREVVDRFMKNPPAAPKTPDSAPDGSPQELVSPAMAVNQFFREHPILKDKITAVRWPSASEVVVEVANFPVEQMPPFARKKFEDRVKELQSRLGEPITIIIAESGSGRPLLSFSPAAP